MPNRSTRAIFSGLLWGWLPLACLSTALAEPPAPGPPYDVVRIDRFSYGQIHGRDAYDGMSRGDFDREKMHEVAPVDRKRPLPPVRLVYPSAPPPVQTVVIEPRAEVVLRGEDRVFDQIRLDEAIQRCVFERICTEEVKAIPGLYLGDEQSGDSDWRGRAEAPEETPPETAAPADPGFEIIAPGRTFMEVPAQSPPAPAPAPEAVPLQRPDPG